MHITSVRIDAGFEGPRHGNSKTDRLRAFASVVFDDCLIVHGIKVIDGDGGLFLSMPSKKKQVVCPGCRRRNDFNHIFCCGCGVAMPFCCLDEGEKAHKDSVHPATTEARKTLEAAVIGAYLDWLEKRREVVVG